MLRVVFMGTPDFAVPTLMEIVGHGHEVVAVYTQPPRKAGRGMSERQSPVAEAAAKVGLPVRTPLNFRDEAEVEAFRELDADVAVVVAYGLILPKAVLEAPAEGCLNLHASKLPRWRGAAPIQRAIMAGDRQTAVAAMRMEEGLDTGPVCLEEVVEIGADETAGELHDRLSRLGANLMGRALAALSRGSLGETPQSGEGVTYARKIEKSEARIDWARPAAEVHDHIRGLSPFPGAWFEVAGERVKVLRSTRGEGFGEAGMILDDDGNVACREGAVRLLQVQPAGGKPMAFADFARGRRIAPGDLLG
ncbi:methionyl-tRNA formyltransferase [Lutibaculum baratangense]|uniref:Methionyl-tRNA formyltransferase n=1 Tax=Lutibaculum baratangense AMV1 TaxID=631454 RepID=V4R4W6_9HYPH|nr:methionyl-tRNA formyltransferase [Lutibaculum baratangense]ESR26987.1 Methionyl-tRNA formyltransferase [Lutibaculum baratangense AMV1]